MNIKSYMLSIMKDERKTPDGCVVGAVLSIASVMYLLLLKIIHFLYRNNMLRSYKVDAKVISVGNITLGGTGKTPFTISLAEDIKSKGRKPAVLIRGYGNDESRLLKERLDAIPVLIGKNRVKNARKAKGEFGCDCIILDDGFQHYRIKRDLDIILIDATSPFGNLKLFPRGLLREPLTRLKDADIALITKSDMGHSNIDYIRGTLMKFNEEIEIVESFYQPVDLRKIFSEEIMPLSYIKNKKVALLAGIANPNYFEWMAGNLGCEIIERFYHIDHYQYRESDMDFIVKKCIEKSVSLIITTEKDVVRIKRLKGMPKKVKMLALRIDFRISLNEKAVSNRLCSIFSS